MCVRRTGSARWINFSIARGVASAPGFSEVAMESDAAAMYATWAEDSRTCTNGQCTSVIEIVVTRRDYLPARAERCAERCRLKSRCSRMQSRKSAAKKLTLARKPLDG